MSIRSAISLAVAAGVLAGLSVGWRQRQRRHAAHARPAALAEPLQTWEGEGGAVPVPEGKAAAQVSPRLGVEGKAEGSLSQDPTPGLVAG